MSSNNQGIFTHLFQYIPDDWELMALPDIVDFQEGPGILAKDFHDEGVPLLRLSSISGPVTTFDGCNYLAPQKVEKKWGHFRLREKDILLSTSGSLGRVSEVASEQEGSICYTGIIRFRPKSDQILYSYIKYFLQSEQFKLQADSSASGSVLSHFGPTHLKKMSFPVAPIAHQKFIVGLLSPIDDKIQLNQQINQTLEQMAQAIFKSWFVDFDPVKAKMDVLEAGGSEQDALLAAMQAISGKDADQLGQLQTEQPEQYAELKATAELFPSAMQDSELGEIPEGWDITTVRDIAEIVKGKSYKSSELESSTTALVTLKSFNRGGGYRLDGLKEYTGKYKPQQEVFAGDLIIAYTDVTQAADVIGKPAMVIGDGRYEHLVISLDVAVIRPDDESLKPYLYGLANTDTFQFHTKSYTTGTTVLHLAKNAVPDYQFAMPSKELVHAYSHQTYPMFAFIDKKIQEGRSLESLRDTLLPKLLSGELTLEPNEENEVATA